MIHYFKGKSTALLARYNIANILKYGVREQRQVGGWCMKKDCMLEMIETENVLFELTNPRNCITSQHCLGVEMETEDYLLGLNPGYVHLSPWKFYKKWIGPDGKYPYTYGERGGKWIDRVIEKLLNDPTSRQVIVNLWDKNFDLNDRFVPCTTQWSFFIRNNKLYMSTTMRSQDGLRGFFLDTMAYPLIQQHVAQSLNLPMGSYYHYIINSHIYGNDIAFAKKLIMQLHVEKSLYLDRLMKDDMKTMEEISMLIFISHDFKNAQKLADTLPPFWRKWKYNQIIYEYTRINNTISTELTIAGLVINTLPDKL